MTFAKNLFLAAGAAALLVSFTPACASSPSDDPAASTDDAATADALRKHHPDYYACTTDSDCVAVPRVGCCDNGWMESVNKHHVRSYEHSFTCPQSNPICPLYIVDDTRQPECNLGTGKCEMVAIDDIACGGFTINPHHCPAGYDCVSNNPNIADIPGSCQAHVDDDGGTDAGPGSDAGPVDGGPGDAGPGTDAGCVQKIMCTRFSHWDSTACTCVANPMCGGFAGIACPSGYTSCVDDPNDGCDPANGGADCSGICVN